MSNHQQICPNGCEFAVKSTLLAYTAKEGDRYVDAEYHWRCTKVDKLITSNSLIYELGCATYNYVRPTEPCICTPEPAPAPIHEPEPIVTAVAEPAIAPEPVITPQRIEPRFVPEQSIPSTTEPIVTAPVPKVRKPRSKPAATVTAPVPIISDTIPIVSASADIPPQSGEQNE